MAFPYNARSSGGYNRNASNSNLSCTVGASTPANNCECVDKRCDSDLHMVLAMAYVLPQKDETSFKNNNTLWRNSAFSIIAWGFTCRKSFNQKYKTEYSYIRIQECKDNRAKNY